MPVSIDLKNPEDRPIVTASQALIEERKKPLIGMTRAALAEVLTEIGVPAKQSRMRASQLWHWLYIRGVSDFTRMHNISKDLRGKLEDQFAIARPIITEEQISEDGTRK